MINVSDGTNVDVRLAPVVASVCAVDVGERGGVLVLERSSEGVEMAVSQGGLRGSHEGRNGAEGGRHLDGIIKEELRKHNTETNRERGGEKMEG